MSGGVAALWEAACSLRGAAPFLADDRLRLSGQAAGAAARAAAARLARAGLAPGGIAAVLAGPSAAQAVAFFGVQVAGGVPCALHLRETEARLQAVLASLAPAVVVAEAAEAERAARLVAAAGLAAPVLEAEALAAPGEGMAPVPRGPGDAAAILLSSGTTGAPKQVLHTQRTVLATAGMAAAVYGTRGPQDAMILPMAPSFAAWLHCVLPFVAIGGRLVFQRRFDPQGYADLMAAERPSVAALVPTVWRMVLPLLPERPEGLRVAMFSGEPGTPELVARLAALAPELRSVHLASEGGCACGIAADRAILTRPGLAGAAGVPVPGAAAMVVDPEAEALVPLPPGETGELAIRGPSLSPGYRGDPALTAARFREGWWRSGDLARCEDGVLLIAGRTDNRITTGGIKVHAEAVEAAILALPGVRAAAVVGAPDPLWGERIVAHVVAEAEPERLAALLEAAGSLPRAHQPKEWVRHAALPVGPTGKLYRRALREGA